MAKSKCRIRIVSLQNVFRICWGLRSPEEILRLTSCPGLIPATSIVATVHRTDRSFQLTSEPMRFPPLLCMWTVTQIRDLDSSSWRSSVLRPVFTEIEPLALFPGVSNPRMTSGRCGVPVGFPNVSELGDLSTPFSRSRWQVESVMFRICWGFRSWRRESYRNIEAEQSV